MPIHIQVINICYSYNVLFLMTNDQSLLSFYRLYSSYETKKTLKLLPQFGTAELEVTCYSQPGATKQSCDGENSTTKIERVERKINIVVSTYEMFVLDLFNSNDFLTGEVIF